MGLCYYMLGNVTAETGWGFQTTPKPCIYSDVSELRQILFTPLTYVCIYIYMHWMGHIFVFLV